MRKIIFRGKKDYNNEWVYGNLIQFDWADFIVKYGSFEERQRVIPETVSQFTGLTDKNGKKIYEEDVIRIHEGRDDFKLTSIIWDNEYLCFEPTNKELRHALKSRHSEHYEVIGNITTTPNY